LLKEQIHGNFYGNLLSFHPPFQIDGNFGYAAGVCEMLVQSQTGVVHLLPALPDSWANGSVHGLKARGGFIVDLQWKDGKLTMVSIKSLNGRRLKVTYGNRNVEMETEKDKAYKLDGELWLAS
jgi:alpha-L-fucosidase 2